jgi:hypothetical protein
MPDPQLSLPDDRRKQLDGIVQQMTSNKETPDTIQLVVNDFKGKYSAAPKPTAKPGYWERLSEMYKHGDPQEHAHDQPNVGFAATHPTLAKVAGFDPLTMGATAEGSVAALSKIPATVKRAAGVAAGVGAGLGAREGAKRLGAPEIIADALGAAAGMWVGGRISPEAAAKVEEVYQTRGMTAVKFLLKKMGYEKSGEGVKVTPKATKPPPLQGSSLERMATPEAKKVAPPPLQGSSLKPELTPKKVTPPRLQGSSLSREPTPKKQLTPKKVAPPPLQGSSLSRVKDAEVAEEPAQAPSANTSLNPKSTGMEYIEARRKIRDTKMAAHFESTGKTPEDVLDPSKVTDAELDDLSMKVSGSKFRSHDKANLHRSHAVARADIATKMRQNAKK